MTYQWIMLVSKNMLTNGVHVILQLLGIEVVLLQQKGEIETLTRNTEH